MAVTKKQLANLKMIKKGEVRNPLGGKAHNKEIKAIKRLTAKEIAEVGSVLLANNTPALKAIVEDAAKNPKSQHSALKSWIAAIAFKGTARGDAKALNVLLDRLVGKVTEKIEVSNPDGGALVNQVVVMLPSNGREPGKT